MNRVVKSPQRRTVGYGPSSYELQFIIGVQKSAKASASNLTAIDAA